MVAFYGIHVAKKFNRPMDPMGYIPMMRETRRLEEGFQLGDWHRQQNPLWASRLREKPRRW